MLYIKYIKSTFLLILIALFLHACENTDDKQTLKQIAITLISNYADGNGQAPTIRNYEDAGIIGVNEKNIQELNAFIETLIAEDIDTEEELNAVIDALGVSLASDIFGPVITLHGPTKLTLNVGDTYTKICATAIDNHDGEVTVYVSGDVDTSKVGTYIVTYSAVDEAGNLSTVERIIYVVTKPTTNGYNITISITALSYPFFDLIFLNTINNDSIKMKASGNLPPDKQFSVALASTENYTITLANAANSVGYCSFVNNYPPSAISDLVVNPYSISGTISSSDITIYVDCPAL